MLLFLLAGLSSCVSHRAIINAPACTDSLYLKLKSKPIDSMTTREYDYFRQKDQECAQAQQLQQANQATAGSATSTVIAVVVGVVVLVLAVSLFILFVA